MLNCIYIYPSRAVRDMVIMYGRIGVLTAVYGCAVTPTKVLL